MSSEQKTSVANMGSKKYSGAPFGVQKSRFVVAGIHPRSRPPGTITQVSYDKKCMQSLNRKLGPGKYNMDTGDFSNKNTDRRANGPGWKQSYEMSQAAKMPHLLYREEWETKQLQKKLLGPGTYDIPDSFKDEKDKPSSILGLCSSRDTRFKDTSGRVPGPGTYGKGGIPHTLLEEKTRTSAGTVGMLDNGGRSCNRQLPEVGSILCPGQYNCRSFTDDLRTRIVSKRGPYDLFTGDRNKPISTGHLAAPKLADLGPGEYDVRSFLAKWTGEQKIRHGRFGKGPRDQPVPSERIHCTTLSQWPRRAEEPGPGSYDRGEQSNSSASKDRPPFGSSAKRMDRKAMKNFTGSTNRVGPGRYNMHYWKERQHRNGNGSAFNSGTKRWDQERDKYLTQRISSKGVPVNDRKFLVPVDKVHNVIRPSTTAQ